MNLFFSFLSIFSVIIFLTGCAASGYHNPNTFNPAPRIEKAGSFAWPLPGGHISQGYGTKEDGITLKGILIEGPAGSPVMAAEDGRVVFTDLKMPGYGKTVIVQHAGPYSTVYARNAELLVTLGEEVKRGQPIARAGTSGPEVSRLYFEVRHESKAEDPAAHLTA